MATRLQELLQAEDRAHRVGQQDRVLVRYLVATGTADDYMWPLLHKKLETLNKVGLSTDNFRRADTTVISDAPPPVAKTPSGHSKGSILHYMETLSDETLAQAVDFGLGGDAEEPSSKRTKLAHSDDDESK